MYRVSPFTYMVSGFLSTAVSGTKVTCAANEFLKFAPVAGQTCKEYLKNYMNGSGSLPGAGGYLLDENATASCDYCPIEFTDVYLAGVNSSFKDAWRVSPNYPKSSKATGTNRLS